MKITIKSKYNKNGEKYFFAENEKGLIFGRFFMGGFAFTHYGIGYAWQWDSLENLEKSLEKYKKSKNEEEIIKTIEI